MGSRPGPGVVAVGEAPEPDDVAVVEARQQLHLEVEGGLRRPLLLLVSAAAAAVVVAGSDDADAPDSGNETAGESRPVGRGRAAGPAGLEHGGEAFRGRLDLPRCEPPDERQGP